MGRTGVILAKPVTLPETSPVTDLPKGGAVLDDANQKRGPFPWNCFVLFVYSLFLLTHSWKDL